jgi:hypothetical protein
MGGSIVTGYSAPQRQGGVPAHQRKKLFGFEEEFFRRQHWALAVMLQKAVALTGIHPKTLQGSINLALQGQACL